ncbi:uncharacterized protein BX664DRAFT_342274 [Halteromyces radiatus]|uniref:uncharacterized protein n=1 Tax=Halteromyces radiatus TaxID=101107 RepID=UPI00221E39D5|nr:uncharacterized protein BX664DRAFT_342274 [Halteromyces radiatus]KAI8080076.1 hypothetical protein BX664DRAFT_342274 [Halteromyces radiatus]
MASTDQPAGTIGDLFLRLRYATDPTADTFFEWQGSVFAFVPGEPPKKVFNVVGMNVAKASVDKDTQQLKMTSRELTYYLSPDNENKKLETWDNPWTKEKDLPVIHIANDPVQMALPAKAPLTINTNPYGSTSAIVTEIPLFYPNPLATEDGIYDDYDSTKMYQAAECFTFRCATDELYKKETIEQVDINWTRVSPPAPFMKMGQYQKQQSKNGGCYLVYHCTGYKLPPGSDYHALKSSVLRHEIEHVVPSYSQAPESFDPKVRGVSSWTYFKQHYDRYQHDPHTTWPIPENHQ